MIANGWHVSQALTEGTSSNKATNSGLALELRRP
jgi:hypothetical protein